MLCQSELISQFSYVFLKQSFGWDIYEYLNKSLVTQSNKVFWSILRDVITMPPAYFYVFDYKNNFDKFTFPDIPRPKISYDVKGFIELPKSEKEFDEIDLLIAIHRAKDPPTPFYKIAKIVNRAESSVFKRYKKLIRRDLIGLELEAYKK